MTDKQAMPFIISGDCQVFLRQLEDGGWMRAVGGVAGAKACHRHAVAPRHRLLRRLSRPWCEAATQISMHVVPHRPVMTVISTRLFHPRKLVTNRPKLLAVVQSAIWTGTRCGSTNVQEAVGAHAGWSAAFDTVEKEFTLARRV